MWLIRWLRNRRYKRCLAHISVMEAELYPSKSVWFDSKSAVPQQTREWDRTGSFNAQRDSEQELTGNFRSILDLYLPAVQATYATYEEAVRATQQHFERTYQ